jgi:murein L,D-transpeptidase YcbB/YkuD
MIQKISLWAFFIKQWRAKVYLRLLGLAVLAVALSGCATSQLKAQNEQLEQRVTDLEKNQQSKDSEIVDLQYQVKDLSSKMDSMKMSAPDQTAETPEAAETSQPAASIDDASNTQIIRVKVGVEKIQRALKSAGVYTGTVDGKLGPGTKEAIIEFQKGHGLKADGVLGHRTWEALKKYLR